MSLLAKALVKAQKQFGPALKQSLNPHFKNRYADLAAVIEAVIDGLNDNGIFLTQVTHPSDDASVIIETIFIHESGEERSMGKFKVPVAKQDPQGYGSATTYARRYSLQTACGIAPEDDDGNAASKIEPRTAQPVQRQVAPPQQRVYQPLANRPEPSQARPVHPVPIREATSVEIDAKKKQALAQLKPPNVAPQTQAQAEALKKGPTNA
jgi:hypothetical protein